MRPVATAQLPTHTPREIVSALFHPAVLVGALGYFVDVYDLILFGVVRVASLSTNGGLGYPPDRLVETGTWLISWQNGGMLLGGVLWGLLGDRVGRLKALFGSIILYSLANLANGFVTNVDQYTVCRFFAGLGLAGELGGCVTLVAEVLPQYLRGYGTLMVSGVGVLGAIAAATVGLHFQWRTAYYIGGGLGFLLLFLRLCVAESGMYNTLRRTGPPFFGSQLLLLLKPSRLGRYLCCILIGLPCWYVIGILMFFSPELARALHCTGDIKAPLAIGISYAGASIGSFTSGLISQYLRARRVVLALYLGTSFVLINIFYFLHNPSPELVYFVLFLTGITVGYWALFVTVAAEHFGTNMRATVATTVPNFSRASVIPFTMLFAYLKPLEGWGPLNGGLLIAWLALGLSAIGLLGLRETFHDDLNYLET